MVGPHADTHAHTHEWEVRQDDSALWYEDGALFIEEGCIYAEEKGHHDSSRGETYYETMYACPMVQVHRYDLAGISFAETEARHGGERLAESFEGVQELYDEEPYLVEAIESRAAERLVEDGEAFDHVDGFGGISTNNFEMTVAVDGTEYDLRFEREYRQQEEDPSVW